MRNISKEMSRISDGRKVSKMKCKFLIPFVVAAMAMLLSPPLASAAAILGDELASFAVLGATPSVTNTGATTLNGDVGVSPAASITGQASLTVNGINALLNPGDVHLNDGTAILAQSQLGIARTNLGLLGPGTTLGGVDLAGLTLRPGVYTVPGGGSNLTGTLTLDGQGDANPFWVFQMPSTLITSSGSSVSFINYTGSGAGLYWNVSSEATLGSGTSFQGNILAYATIALIDGATIGCGRALSDTAAVTMIGNTITAGCLGTGLVFAGAGTDTVVKDTTTSGGGTGGGTVVSVPGPAPVPEPGTMMLLGSGLVGLVGWGRKKLRK